MIFKPGTSGVAHFGIPVKEIQIGGVLVCIVGTTEPKAATSNIGAAKKEHPSKVGAAFSFPDDGGMSDINELLRIGQQLRKKCHILVALTHTRTGRDMILYRESVKLKLYWDAIFGGHDHYAVNFELTLTDTNVPAEQMAPGHN